MSAPQPPTYLDLNAAAQAVGGVIVAGSPWWIDIVFGTALILKMVALLGGAIIAVYGARRSLFPKRTRRSTDRKH